MFRREMQQLVGWLSMKLPLEATWTVLGYVCLRMYGVIVKGLSVFIPDSGYNISLGKNSFLL